MKRLDEALSEERENEETPLNTFKDFCESLNPAEKKAFSSWQKHPLFDKLAAHLSQKHGEIIPVGVIKLRYVGDAPFTVRTRTHGGTTLKKGDVIALSEGAFGRAYERMKAFEKL